MQNSKTFDEIVLGRLYDMGCPSMVGLKEIDSFGCYLNSRWHHDGDRSIEICEACWVYAREQFEKGQGR